MSGRSGALRRALVAAIFPATLVVAACTQQPAGPAAQASGTPVAGGTVTIPIVADPTLNPWSPNAFIESLFVNRVLFDGLTKPGKDLAPAPDLAASWSTSADGLSWTFNLREGVKWSDGQPFTADDVAFTFNDIVLRPELAAPNRNNVSPLKSVTAVDATTVRFDLSRKFSALTSYLAYNSGIVPKHVLTAEPLQTNSFKQVVPGSTGPVTGQTFTS